ncbi:MAG TPA: O-antigen ligase family protein [Desulfobaccales bacterium]|nr:O-antigen ligase family protein [Desulfobaccales bacterium]
MSYKSIINNFSLLNQLAFYFLLGSGAYIILLWSPHILGEQLGFWTQIVIYLFPWLMLWPAYSWRVITAREHRLEIILMVSIIILGVVNTSLSGSVSKSVHTMRTFLLTGIFALWASLFLINTPRRRQMFDWFCAGALGIIILVEMIFFLVQGKYGPGVFQFFVLHLIPLGTLIILLSSGPVRLTISKNSPAKLLGWLLFLLGGTLIYLTHKRGTLLALAVMLAVWVLYLVRRRKYLLISMALIIALAASLQAQRRFARLDPNIPRDVAILHRLELYPFALHIWKTHPVMGIGLRSFTHEQYLPDYQLHNQDLHEFPQTVASLQTLDNMLLTGLVELGTVMTLFYLGLIVYILVKYCRRLRSWPESSPLDWYRVLVLLGFAIHSLTYDSLLFPPVNWLFHVQLGIMAGFHASETAPG